MTAQNNQIKAQQLLELSDQVSRIASSLARLSTQSGLGHPATPPLSDAPSEISIKHLRTLIRARRFRTRFFDDELFADPAWDMMLDLLEAELSQRRVAVSSLCLAAAVPATTALRWIKALVEKGLFIRRADPFDGRRFFVELSPEASQALRRYFVEVEALPPL
jgi:DNA-binding MarR family transcriptional regulator